MNNEPLDMIPLRQANYCANCETITKNGLGSSCPSCGSQAIRPLSAFLNRPELPRTLPELSEFIQVATPESIRKMLGYPQEILE